MNASNLLELIEPRGGDSVAETMANDLAAVEEQARRTGRPILAHLNHPNFGYAITAEELAAGRRRSSSSRSTTATPRSTTRATRPTPASSGCGTSSTRSASARCGRAPVYGLATDDAHHYFGRGLDARAGAGSWSAPGT